MKSPARIQLEIYIEHKRGNKYFTDDEVKAITQWMMAVDKSWRECKR